MNWGQMRRAPLPPADKGIAIRVMLAHNVIDVTRSLRFAILYF